MALPSAEPVVGETISIEVECTDCGHTRWLRPEQLRPFGIGPETPLVHLAQRLSCSACRADSLPGKTISVRAAFATDKVRERVDRYVAARSRTVPAAGLRARSA